MIYDHSNFRSLIQQGAIMDPNILDKDEDDSDDEDEDRPKQIFCMVASDSPDIPVFGVMLKNDGEVVLYRKYPRLLLRSHSDAHPHYKQKATEVKQLAELIEKKKVFFRLYLYTFDIKMF